MKTLILILVNIKHLAYKYIIQIKSWIDYLMDMSYTIFEKCYTYTHI